MKTFILAIILFFIFLLMISCKKETDISQSNTIVVHGTYNSLEIITIDGHEYVSVISSYRGGICHHEGCHNPIHCNQ